LRCNPQPSGHEALLASFRELWPKINAALLTPNAAGGPQALRRITGCMILAAGQRDCVKVERSLAAGMPWLSTKLFGAEAGRQRLATLQQGIQRFCDAEGSCAAR
jgi:hypothetical protein